MSALATAAIAWMVYGPQSVWHWQQFDIEAGPAQTTLTEWGRVSHMQILFYWDELAGARTQAVHGPYLPIAALRRMLDGTTVDFDFVTDNTLAVFTKRRQCQPELGAAAPLPPCTPAPLTP